MITETSQRITGFVSTKTEILHDRSASCAPTPRPSPRTVLTLTAHH
jgi:hypothetical protein